jgi:hypothetical protein
MDVIIADLLNSSSLTSQPDCVTSGKTFTMEPSARQQQQGQGCLLTNYFRPWESDAAVTHPQAEHQSLSAGTKKIYGRRCKQAKTSKTAAAAVSTTVAVKEDNKREETSATSTCFLPVGGDGNVSPSWAFLPASVAPWALSLWYACLMHMHAALPVNASASAALMSSPSSSLSASPVLSAASGISPPLALDGDSPLGTKQRRKQKKVRRHHHQHQQGTRQNRTLESQAVCTLKNWFSNNRHHPYPDTTDIAQLTADTGLTHQQVKKWMANRRARSGHVTTTAVADVTRTSSGGSHYFDDATQPQPLSALL